MIVPRTAVGLALALAVSNPVSPPAAAAAGVSVASQSSSGRALSPELLDTLLAPVALYPDQLLAQMLLCAARPDEVQRLSTWLKQTKGAKGSQLQEAAQKAGFEPSFVALSLFPQVVDQMAADPTWTAELGQAFAVDRNAVFASVQRLRAQSQAVGNLKDTPQQNVETRTTQSGQQVIVIEPANPQVVYVPQYNPQVIYTQPVTQTVVVQQEANTGAAVAAGAIGFAAGIAIGAAIDNDYYYGPYGWRGGAYMYNDAWDDWYDDREDAREDFYEHREDAREDLSENREDLARERGERSSTAQQQRTERAETAQQQRTERTQTRQEGRPDTQAQREQRRTEAQGASTQARSTDRAAAAGATSYEARGRSQAQGQRSVDRSGTRSDAFSGYSSGRSERAASSRGQRSRSSSGGGRSRR